MKHKIVFVILICITSCNTTMNVESLSYNSQLKKVEIADITLNTITLKKIVAPYYKDYSNQESATARNYKSYDTFGFRDTLLQEVSEILSDTVLKLMIISPKKGSSFYDGFAYLSNKNIVGLQFSNNKNFEEWLDIIFQRNYNKLEEYKKSGQFERQPELNRNPQFMLVLGKGQFSQKWVNSGMLVDERPYENTGSYLHKNAPKQYNETKIAAEKSKYLEKYIDTKGAKLDTENLKTHFANYLLKNNLKAIAPSNNKNTFQEFETLSGFAFPQELKTLFTMHNGTDNGTFLSAQQILTAWKNWKVIYDDPNWMLVELTGNSDPDGRKTLGMYSTPYWVPFISTGGGNFIAIDYAPGSKGTSGQIIAFGPDEGKIKYLAENLIDFLKQ